MKARALAPRDVDRFRAFLSRRFGLQYDESRLGCLADILAQRIEGAKSPDFAGYMKRLSSPTESPAELRALAEQVTVPETFFFRNPDNFRAFREVVLPARVAARRGVRQLSILSAGCASGEEPYSLAIAMREQLPEVGSWDLRILGVDINAAMLKRAAEARYSRWSLRATPAEARQRYFEHSGRDFVLEPGVRQMVAFQERNLAVDDAQLWIPGTYDVVFCRNVFMYFTPEAMRNAVRRMRDALLPGGFLFLGHAETLRGISQAFHLCHTHDTFYYQRGESDSPVASERSASLAPRTDDGVLTTHPWDLTMVVEAIREEHFSDALALLAARPADARDHPDALLVRAALLTNSGRLEEAAETCARLIALGELSAGAHYLMALCREQAGDRSGALEQDQMAIDLDAIFAMPHLHLGLLAKRSGEPMVARRELGRALVLLADEDAHRLLLFGGGFSRRALLQLCGAELRAVGGDA